jgi:hypothetical protein
MTELQEVMFGHFVPSPENWREYLRGLSMVCWTGFEKEYSKASEME